MTYHNSLTVFIHLLFVYLQMEHETRRNQLMRDMAQLRLQAEVKELEGSVSSATPAFPPYVLPDTSALVEAHGLIRQLAHSARFIIIIPLAGQFIWAIPTTVCVCLIN